MFDWIFHFFLLFSLFLEFSVPLSPLYSNKPLGQSLKFFRTAVQNAVKVPLSQLEFDALVSFVYNVGAGNFRNSTLLRKLNQNDRDGAADEFLKWIYVAKKPSNGLIDRRRQERILFKEEVSRFRKESGIAYN